jgi:hypothetical protein
LDNIGGAVKKIRQIEVFVVVISLPVKVKKFWVTAVRGEI